MVPGPEAASTLATPSPHGGITAPSSGGPVFDHGLGAPPGSLSYVTTATTAPRDNMKSEDGELERRPPYLHVGDFSFYRT